MVDYSLRERGRENRERRKKEWREGPKGLAAAFAFLIVFLVTFPEPSRFDVLNGMFPWMGVGFSVLAGCIAGFSTYKIRG